MASPIQSANIYSTVNARSAYQQNILAIGTLATQLRDAPDANSEIYYAVEICNTLKNAKKEIDTIATQLQDAYNKKSQIDNAIRIYQALKNTENPILFAISCLFYALFSPTATYQAYQITEVDLLSVDALRQNINQARGDLSDVTTSSALIQKKVNELFCNKGFGSNLI